MSQEAAQRLRDFLREFRLEIHEILADRHLQLVAEDLREDLRSLWESAELSAGELDSRLGAIAEGHDPEAERSLEIAGLEGRELDIKLRAYTTALEAFREERDRTYSRPRGGWRALLEAVPLPQRVRDWIRRRGRGLQPRRLLARFASLLRWIDVPLESLAGAFGAGEALKEAKKALEAAVADEQDRAQGVS